jgi:Family of unknown function (DUF6187)
MPSLPADGASPADSVFSLPAVDDPPSTEAGVILLGLDAAHLLAGLAVASLADDPAAVTLLADQVWHRGVASFDAGQLEAAGAARWRAVREVLRAAVGPGTWTAPPRLAWAQAYTALARCDVGPLGPATAVYLTACLLRHAEMDRYCETLPGPAMEALA